MLAWFPLASVLHQWQKGHCVPAGDMGTPRRLRVAAVHSGGVMFQELIVTGGGGDPVVVRSQVGQRVHELLFV